MPIRTLFTTLHNEIEQRTSHKYYQRGGDMPIELIGLTTTPTTIYLSNNVPQSHKKQSIANDYNYKTIDAIVEE